MNRRQILWLVAIAVVALWLWKSGRITKDAPVPSAVPHAEGPSSEGPACLAAAEEAARQTQAAAAVLLRAPIDPAAFSSAADSANAAISEAEGKCGGGGSARERQGTEDARGALSEMRALLSDFSGALAGGGSASEAPRRQETIDTKLAAARAALRG